MTALTLAAISVVQGKRKVIDHVDLSLQPGEFVGLLGPNGAGKTTLLRAALGLLPHQGQSSLSQLSPIERAKRAAFMPQGRDIIWPITVERLVALGRIAHGASDPSGAAAIEDAIDALELAPMRHRPATQLSGGEQARALIARALAQKAPLLIADEPVAGLDPAAQIKVMRVFASLAAQGHGVLASLHDLGLAARYCTRLILLHQGRIAADGPPAQVLSAENLAHVFGITAHFSQGPQGAIFQPLDLLVPQKGQPLSL